MSRPCGTNVTRLGRIALVACVLLCLPGCFQWRLSVKASMLAALAAACIVIIVAARRILK